MRILVTGATGFIGKHTIPKLLESNAQLALITRNRSNLKEFDSTKLQIIEAPLENITDCADHIKKFNPQVCLHLAWTGIPDYSQFVSRKNLNISIDLIDFLIDNTNCSKFVVSGSCFEYGKQLGTLDEKNSEDNTSAIAWAKNSLKNYLAQRCHEKNLNWIWLRIFYAYGPGQRTNSLIPSLFRSIRQGQAPHLQNPNNANDFVHISDVASAISIACSQNVESGIYNVGSGSLMRVSDILDLVQKYTKSLEMKIDNKFANQELSGKTASQAIGGYANIEKIKNNFKWEPKIPFDTGVKEFIAYLSNQENI